MAQPRNGKFQNRANASLVNSNEGVVVHVGEKAHDKLAVHTIRDATVTRDGISKVLDLEATLKARSKEASERGDERRKRSQNQSVQLYRSKSEGYRRVVGQKEELRNGVRARNENGVWIALEAGEDVGTEVLSGSLALLKWEIFTKYIR